ncbi:MAG: hypothetical protein IPF67_20115 [Saprospiraceae bacterium]|nr:hypothetical protein [Candidatus Brachybacter algidus]
MEEKSAIIEMDRHIPLAAFKDAWKMMVENMYWVDARNNGRKTTKSIFQNPIMNGNIMSNAL